MNQIKSPNLGAAAAQCARSLGTGLAVVIGAPLLMIGAGNLVGTGWTAWQSLLTNDWTNVWPATWTVWLCTLLAAWCACMTYKLREHDVCLWFAASCAALLLLGALPANCAVWAITEDWNMRETPPLDRVAAVSALVFAMVAFFGPVIAFVSWLMEQGTETAK